MPRRAKILDRLETLEPKYEIKLYQFRQPDGTIKYGAHPNQQQIINDTHRFKVVACGRRFGKTTFAVNELLYNALTKEKTVYWYVAPTYRQAKMLAWKMLEEILGNLPTELVLKKNEAELTVEFANNSRIEVKGADNEDSLRGVALDGVVMDEYAFTKPYVFDRIIRPALADHRGWGIFISTPHGYNHFWELFKKGQVPNSQYKSWKFKSSDNPFLPPEEIEAARLSTDAATFAQEWESDFRMFKGLIYKDFDSDIHVKEKEINAGSSFYRTMDFGASNPTVCLWVELDRDDNIYVFDEYYEPGHSIDYHAGMVKAKHPELDIRATFGDPSALQEHLDYAHWQIYITPAIRIFTTAQGTTESWVKLGISKVSEYLRINPVTKAPRLQIHPKCKNLIREFQGYEWDELRGVTTDKPRKIDDHALDALRYFICSYGGPRKEEHKYVYQPRSETTGY